MNHEAMRDRGRDLPVLAGPRRALTENDPFEGSWENYRADGASSPIEGEILDGWEKTKPGGFVVRRTRRSFSEEVTRRWVEEEIVFGREGPKTANT